MPSPFYCKDRYLRPLPGQGTRVRPQALGASLRAVEPTPCRRVWSRSRHSGALAQPSAKRSLSSFAQPSSPPHLPREGKILEPLTHSGFGAKLPPGRRDHPTPRPSSPSKPRHTPHGPGSSALLPAGLAAGARASGSRAVSCLCRVPSQGVGRQRSSSRSPGPQARGQD